MRDKLSEFLRETGLEKQKGWFAEQIGADTQNVNDWLKSGALPAWAVMNIVREFPEARPIFQLEPLVVEEAESYGCSLDVGEPKLPSWYQDRKRREIIHWVKELVPLADDEVIDALHQSVKIFKSIPPKKEEGGK